MNCKTIVCTLFEGNYHIGVAALSNSLYKSGFRGSIYAGYKGFLPKWADAAAANILLKWEGGRTLSIAEGLDIHFLPLKTDYHLTNYKPNFMLQLLSCPASDSEGIFYFDPDIIVKCKWSYFEEWITYGVALVHEIISNDMPPSHPLRMKWGDVILKADKQINRRLNSYINGGFCGVSTKNAKFLQDWIDITNAGIKHFSLTGNQWKHDYDRQYIFFAQDQDALNITAMATENPVSEMGPEAMDFIHGGFTMSHAVGSPKPWAKKFLTSMVKGEPPSFADKSFWQHTQVPIKLYSVKKMRYKKTCMNIASFMGRFYRKH